jgi:hypothetical protein
MNAQQHEAWILKARILEQTSRGLRKDLVEQFGAEKELGALAIETHESAKQLLNSVRDLTMTEPPTTKVTIG